MNDHTTNSSTSILEHEVSKWIIDKIFQMDNGRAKFCSYNAVRFLQWANDILETSPIVSSFCALNATEEAVAAFISAAKKHGHRDHAKYVNLHNHYSKALISVFAQRCSNLAHQGKLGFALLPEQDKLVFRIQSNDGNPCYGDLHLNIFRIHPNTNKEVNGGILLGDMPLLEELEEQVKRATEVRNKLLYATDTGIQTGFIDPGACLVRETQLALGLIWATIDMHMYPDQDRPFVDVALEKMASFSKSQQKKK